MLISLMIGKIFYFFFESFDLKSATLIPKLTVRLTSRTTKSEKKVGGALF